MLLKTLPILTGGTVVFLVFVRRRAVPHQTMSSIFFYMPQVQGYLEILDLQYCDVISYTKEVSQTRSLSHLSLSLSLSLSVCVCVCVCVCSALQCKCVT